MNTLIVDSRTADASQLRKLLASLPDHFSEIVIAKSFASGVQNLNARKWDLVFFEIELEDQNGFYLLPLIQALGAVPIIVTTKPDFALHALQNGVFDYLLKPTQESEIRRLLQRLSETGGVGRGPGQQGKNGKPLALPTYHGFDMVSLKDVVWCQANGNYTNFHLTGKQTLTVSKSLIEFERLLKDRNFIRIHHQHMVNLLHVQQYHKGKGGEVVMTDGHLLQVSRRRKEAFVNSLVRV